MWDRLKGWRGEEGDEVQTLRSRVANIERDGCTPSKDTPTPPTNLGRSCILPVDMRTFNDGEFARNSDGQICYCRVSHSIYGDT